MDLFGEVLNLVDGDLFKILGEETLRLLIGEFSLTALLTIVF
jgi:hypothetical protein